MSSIDRLFRSNGKNIKLYVDDLDISGIVRDVEISSNCDMVDITMFGEATKVVKGLTTTDMRINGICDPSTIFPTVPVRKDPVSYSTNTTNFSSGPSRPPKYRDGGAPHRMKPSLMKKVPWDSVKVIIIGFDSDAEPATTYAKSLEEKRKLAFENFDNVLVAWPGTFSQDLFYVKRKDLNALRKAMGLKPKSERVLVAEDGEEWSA